MTDQPSSTNTQSKYIGLTAGVVSAFVGNNSVPTTDLPTLISNVHAALQNAVQGPPVPVLEKPTPAVSIRKSITPDFLISLEDGKSYKSLKRHLTGRGLTPEQYREKWGLPRDYPMVAPNYAAARSELAKSMGLGQVRKKTAKGTAKRTSASPNPAGAPSPKKRGRKPSDRSTS